MQEGISWPTLLALTADRAPSLPGALAAAGAARCSQAWPHVAVFVVDEGGTLVQAEAQGARWPGGPKSACAQCVRECVRVVYVHVYVSLSVCQNHGLNHDVWDQPAQRMREGKGTEKKGKSDGEGERMG